MAEKYTSELVRLPPLSALGESSKWAVTIEGVDQMGPSYQGNVQFVVEGREPIPAGTFHLFGYGVPANDEAKTLPIDVQVEATDAIRQLVESGVKSVVVEVVPQLRGAVPGQRQDLSEGLGIKKIS